MLDERASHIWRQIWRDRSSVPAQGTQNLSRQEAVVSTIYFLLAVAAASAAIFALMTRAEKVNRRRGSSDGGSSDPSINDSSVASWFGPYGGGRGDR
jgi:hypothetical protein